MESLSFSPSCVSLVGFKLQILCLMQWATAKIPFSLSAITLQYLLWRLPCVYIQFRSGNVYANFQLSPYASPLPRIYLPKTPFISHSFSPELWSLIPQANRNVLSVSVLATPTNFYLRGKTIQIQILSSNILFFQGSQPLSVLRSFGRLPNSCFYLLLLVFFHSL